MPYSPLHTIALFLIMPKNCKPKQTESHGAHLFLNKLLRDMSHILYGDGEQTRDFVYVKDVVKANLLAMTCKKATRDVFNVASDTRTSINKLAELLKGTLNKRDIKNFYTDPRPGDVEHGCADIRKAKRILDYTPSFSLKEGLNELIKWYAKNETHSYAEGAHSQRCR